MDSLSEVMYHLHWLPIRQRIHHKTVMLIFKCISGEAPQYLRDMISIHHQSRPSLHSNHKYKTLHEHKTLRKTFEDWSFKIAASRLWNRLPVMSNPVLLLTLSRDQSRHIFLDRHLADLSMTNTESPKLAHQNHYIEIITNISFFCKVQPKPPVEAGATSSL